VYTPAVRDPFFFTKEHPMMNDQRVWCVSDVTSPEDLAEKLTNHTWTLCTGFRLKGYLFLNDATHEDGAAEFGVVKEDGILQVESITFSWFGYDRALALIRSIVAGAHDDARRPILLKRIDTPDNHRCRHCA